MAAKAVFRNLQDPCGARDLLKILNVDPEAGITITGGASKLLFIQDEGCYILDEIPGARRASRHAIEFVSYENIDAIVMELTDLARRSDDPIDVLRGMTVSLSYESSVIGGDMQVEIQGDMVIATVDHDDDAVRLWGLVLQLQNAAVSAGTSVVVSAGSE